MSNVVIGVLVGSGFIVFCAVLLLISDGWKAALRCVAGGIALIVLLAALVGCNRAAADDPVDVSKGFGVGVVSLDDGREVTCIAWKGSGAWGGLSCDWQEAQ